MSNYTRRQFLKIIGVSAISSVVPLQELLADKQDKPNILLIITDQQSSRAISACGNPYLSTPNMDAIAANGIRFENSYCTSPVCGPARSSLITSRMPHETGVEFNIHTPGQSKILLNPSLPTLGNTFRAAGYQTVWIGRWHLMPKKTEKGFDTSVPALCSWFNKKMLGNCNIQRSAKDYDEIAVEAAIQFLQEEYRYEKPLFLVVSLLNPHDICRWIKKPPIKHHRVHDFPPLPANFAIDPNEPEFLQQCRKRIQYGAEILYTKYWDNNQWRAYLDAYYRFTEEVDKVIGRLLTVVKETGFDKNALLMLTSDHGEGMAAHHWVTKLTLYEEVVTVPLIISGKGIPPNSVDKNHLVSSLDILPTLCDYAGIIPPQDIYGISLRPLIENPKLLGRDFLVSELQPDPRHKEMEGRMVRTQRYKYIVFSQGHRSEMLFDLAVDPGETQNLALDTNMQYELERHRVLLQQWLKQTRDNFSILSA
jgi:arylsulfatase A-like enzyme